MTRCCSKHCKGSCHHRKGRVERGGKSVFAGHCASAARCEAAMSREALVQAAALFRERCEAADKRRGKCRDDDDDEDECEGDCTSGMHKMDQIMDRRWNTVDCNFCTTQAIQGCGFYHSDQMRVDICERCWNSRVTPDVAAGNVFVYWTSMEDPYGGNEIAVWVPRGYSGPCTPNGCPCGTGESSECGETSDDD